MQTRAPNRSRITLAKVVKAAVADAAVGSKNRKSFGAKMTVSYDRRFQWNTPYLLFHHRNKKKQ